MTAAGRQLPPPFGRPPPPWLAEFIRDFVKVSTNSALYATPIAGGVSSDIYRVDAEGSTLCVKRALPKLRVAADWHVPVERNRYEAEWIRVAGGVVPGAVPELLAEDRDGGIFAMRWLPPERYPVWKAQLRDGAIDLATAARVGNVLGRVHAATADRADVAARFPTDALFDAIRLEPYLIATGRVHADLAARLAGLAEITRTTRRVLVHGDFSPKNLLIGPGGPVILDAECAWFGDPAFDLAFVLNHLLLKGAWRPQWRERYLDAFAALVDAYRAHAAWERWPDLEARTAALVCALMLARVDGKSPVEYLTEEADRARVRAFARARLAEPAPSLGRLASAWAAA